MDEIRIHLNAAQIMRMNVIGNVFISSLDLFLDMIFDNDPQISKYISPPKELQTLNCSVFYGGIIEAILISNGYVRTCSI